MKPGPGESLFFRVVWMSTLSGSRLAILFDPKSRMNGRNHSPAPVMIPCITILALLTLLVATDLASGASDL